MKTLTALTLRKQLGATLDEVADSGTPILITRGNRPLAVLVAPAEYEALTGGRERRLGLAAQRVAEWRAEYVAGTRRRDTAALVRGDRDNRR
jgi:prevent-host-death family protein